MLQTTLAPILMALSLTAAQAAGPKNEAPLRALPYSPSLDRAAMDAAADPCVDFYKYSCGGWMKKNPIPSDQASWSVYGKLAQDNQRFLWGILSELSAPAPLRTPPQQKIGDFFATCMDESAIERAGLVPLKPWLFEIDALTSVSALPPLLARLHLATMAFYDGHVFFGFGAQQDFEDSSRVIAESSAGGLGLPDRDYYTRTDAKSKRQQKKYRAHIQAMLERIGIPKTAAATQAGAIYAIEDRLARASLTLVEKRDPHNLAHKMSVADLQKLTPSFDWQAYLRESGAPDVQTLNVDQPKFLAALEAELAKTPLDALKAYLRWHVMHAFADYLSKDVVKLDFDFFRHELRGVPDLKARWKRCVSWTDGLIGEALGQEFVRRTFTDDTKRRAAEMTALIESAMDEDLKSLAWMNPKTREEALKKLRTIHNKIGFPEKWRDYSALSIDRGDFVSNVIRAQTFESKRWIAKIDKPVDRDEWQMTPPTVNAYYDGQLNEINFPAGVLQPPLFDVKTDDAPNYGNTGSTIGHELTHGFDDEGRQFDAKGNLRDWWTPEDDRTFKERAQCVVDQYGKYVVVDGIKINSKLTEGEDIADLGGTVLAYAAWRKTLDGKPEASPGFKQDGLTPDQRFFIGLAQWACENERPENLRHLALTNPHSPGRYRINGVVANLPEFQRAFACKAGSPMVNAAPCKVW